MLLALVNSRDVSMAVILLDKESQSDFDSYTNMKSCSHILSAIGRTVRKQHVCRPESESFYLNFPR